MIPIYPDLAAYQAHLAALPQTTAQVEGQVREIITQVRRRGDQALMDYTERFDQVKLGAIRVPREEMDKAVAYMDPAVRDVWIQAIHNIEKFHQRQMEHSQLEFFGDGSVLGWKVSAIHRVGVYIPGGRAVYPSSLFMNVIPAQIAGCQSIAVVCPPAPPSENNPGGLPHKDILAAAALLDLDEIYAVGGAQAIAALAYGTASIPKVFKITGPGNAYVAEAKRQVFGQVGIDSVAGPSEILILSDASAPVEWVVRDLLSQAEHDPQARAILVTTSPAEAQAVATRLAELVPTLPRREIIEASIRGPSAVIVVPSLEVGVGVAEAIAPEHMELLVANPMEWVGRIDHAGALFVGPHTPEPVGDYYAGPNHTLPTSGTAAFSSPLGVYDFLKRTSVLMYSPQRLAKEGQAIARFAEREGLAAHAAAVRARLGK